jgi:hypothetical protein
MLAGVVTQLAVAPKDAEDAHREHGATLEEVLARCEECVLTKVLTFSGGEVKYAVRTKGPGLALRGAKIPLLRCFLDGSMLARFKARDRPTA